MYVSKAVEESRIKNINAIIKEKNMRWTAGRTTVSRLTYEEMKKRCGTIIDPADFETGGIKILEQDKRVAKVLPAKFDWRNVNGKNYTTPAKDQGGCGSCWIFCVTGAVESIIKIVEQNPNKEINLSEQHILSCNERFGCGGGTLKWALEFIRDTGVVDEPCFPYQARDDIPCEDVCSDWELRIIKLSGANRFMHAGHFKYWMDYPTRTFIKQMIQSSPVMAPMAVFSDFFFYTGGIYDRTSDDYSGGHGISVIGWDDTEQCWICKNSWGTDWGEDGYFKIAYNYADYPDFKPIDTSSEIAVYCSNTQIFSDMEELKLK